MTEDKKRKRRIAYSQNVRKHIFYGAKCRAKKNGIPFDISIEDVVIPEFCPVLGIRLNEKITDPNDPAPKRSVKDSSPSLDRIHPEKGYVKGNIQIISHRANTIKNSGTLEEHKKIIKYMENLDNQRLRAAPSAPAQPVGAQGLTPLEPLFED